MVRKIKTNIKNKFLNDYQNHLEKIDTYDLIDKIEKFRKLNFKNITTSELSNEILKVLSYENSASIIPDIRNYPKNTKFYRIRKLDQENLKIPLETIKCEADAWAPPKNIIHKYGRLNKPNESLLYTTPLNCIIPIEEMKIKENEYFALIVYNSKEEIKVNCIGIEKDYEKLGLAKEEIVKAKILDNFLVDEFTREVGEGTEHLYKISELIAKDYFDLPPKVVQDAWLYPSVASKAGYNVCFREEIAKEKLELLGVQLLKYNKKENDYYFQVACVCLLNDDKTFEYLNCSNERVQKVFPEINYE